MIFKSKNKDINIIFYLVPKVEKKIYIQYILCKNVDKTVNITRILHLLYKCIKYRQIIEGKI